MDTTLTLLENRYLARFREGMDEENCGWLHEMAQEGKTTSGVIGSLVKKGLITSTLDKGDPFTGAEDAYWIEVTEKGQIIVL